MVKAISVLAIATVATVSSAFFLPSNVILQPDEFDHPAIQAAIAKSNEDISDDDDFQSADLDSTSSSPLQDGCEYIDYQKHWAYLKTANIAISALSHSSFITQVATLMAGTSTMHVPSSPYDLTGLSFGNFESFTIHPIRALSPTQMELKVSLPNPIQINSQIFKRKIRAAIKGSTSFKVVVNVKMAKCIMNTWREYLTCVGKSTWSYVKSVAFFRTHKEFIGRFESLDVESVEFKLGEASFQWKDVDAMVIPKPISTTTEAPVVVNDEDNSDEEYASAVEEEDQMRRKLFFSNLLNPASALLHGSGVKSQKDLVAQVVKKLSTRLQSSLNKLFASWKPHMKSRCHRRRA